MNADKKVLLPDVLADKTSPETVKVLSLGYEYMLAGIAKEYSKTIGVADFEGFNQKNRFSWTELAVHPFFISTATPYSESLYKLFGDFRVQAFGPASMPIYHLITKTEENFQNTDLKYFKIEPNESPFNVEVILDNKSYNNFDGIKEQIKHQEIELADRKILFKDIFIKKDFSLLENEETEAPLYQVIDRGIEVISSQSKKFFAPNCDSIVLFKASYFPAFRNAIENYKNTVLPYEAIKQAPKPFSEKERSFTACY